MLLPLSIWLQVSTLAPIIPTDLPNTIIQQPMGFDRNDGFHSASSRRLVTCSPDHALRGVMSFVGSEGTNRETYDVLSTMPYIHPPLSPNLFLASKPPKTAIYHLFCRRHPTSRFRLTPHLSQPLNSLVAPLSAYRSTSAGPCSTSLVHPPSHHSLAPPASAFFRGRDFLSFYPLFPREVPETSTPNRDVTVVFLLLLRRARWSIPLCSTYLQAAALQPKLYTPRVSPSSSLDITATEPRFIDRMRLAFPLALLLLLDTVPTHNHKPPS
jgi:hypothetical protein